MENISVRQGGGSTIFNLLLLAAAAYGVYVGIQYVPQWIEARSIQSVLDSVKNQQRADPVGSAFEARAKVIKLLQINDMNDMVDAFEVDGSSGGGYIITFEWDRELNLLYETKEMHYVRSVRL